MLDLQKIDIRGEFGSLQGNVIVSSSVLDVERIEGKLRPLIEGILEDRVAPHVFYFLSEVSIYTQRPTTVTFPIRLDIVPHTQVTINLSLVYRQNLAAGLVPDLAASLALPKISERVISLIAAEKLALSTTDASQLSA